MIKISQVVENIVLSSEIALSALTDGYLNLSAYAKTIRNEVEARARKPVRTGSIVVALSRLAGSLEKRPPLLPQITAENLTVKSGLVEIAFDKTKENQDRIRALYRDTPLAAADFFTVTQGVGEISIIVPRGLATRVLGLYKKQKPKLMLNDLAALTMRFEGKYISIPNAIYALVRYLALQRINIVEIVSTFTELTFILHQNDLDKAFIIMRGAFQKSQSA